MARPKAKINPIWGNNLKELCEKERVTQKELSESIYISQQTISKIINHTASLTEETARQISEKYPGYSFEWLMGYVDYKNELEHFSKALSAVQDEGDALMSGLLTFAKLSGFEIKFASPAHGQEDNAAPVEKWLKMFKDGYVVSRGEQKRCISLEQMNQLQNEIYDFVEFKLNKLLGGNNNG